MLCLKQIELSQKLPPRSANEGAWLQTVAAVGTVKWNMRGKGFTKVVKALGVPVYPGQKDIEHPQVVDSGVTFAHPTDDPLLDRFGVKSFKAPRHTFGATFYVLEKGGVLFVAFKWLRGAVLTASRIFGRMRTDVGPRGRGKVCHLMRML